MTTFQQQQTRRQVEFKRRHWLTLLDGESPQRPDHLYAHILLAPAAYLDLHHPVQQEVATYLRSNDIALHQESANLRNSQVCCFNRSIHCAWIQV
jgi:hypothetical protein